jgi:hypothetical protein
MQKKPQPPPPAVRPDINFIRSLPEQISRSNRRTNDGYAAPAALLCGILCDQVPAGKAVGGSAVLTAYVHHTSVGAHRQKFGSSYFSTVLHNLLKLIGLP